MSGTIVLSFYPLKLPEPYRKFTQMLSLHGHKPHGGFRKLGFWESPYTNDCSILVCIWCPPIHGNVHVQYGQATCCQPQYY